MCVCGGGGGGGVVPPPCLPCESVRDGDSSRDCPSSLCSPLMTKINNKHDSIFPAYSAVPMATTKCWTVSMATSKCWAQSFL